MTDADAVDTQLRNLHRNPVQVNLHEKLAYLMFFLVHVSRAGYHTVLFCVRNLMACDTHWEVWLVGCVCCASFLYKLLDCVSSV